MTNTLYPDNKLGAKYSHLQMYMLNIDQLKQYQDELLEKENLIDKEYINLLIIEQRFLTLDLNPFGVPLNVQ